MVEQKEIWDEYYKKGNLWNKETTTLPNILNKKVVLEIGAGNGKTLKSILKQKPKELVAIDISKQAIKLCKSQFPNNNINFLHESIAKTSFPEKYFDIIVCYYTLNNLSQKETPRAIKEMHRILKDKGIILFEDFAVGDFRESMYQHIDKNTIQKQNGIICHFFNEKELKYIFNQFKNKNIKIQTSKPIKNHKDLIRSIIKAIIRK